MNRTAFAALSLILPATGATAEDYQWTLSLSDKDPYVNTGAPTSGVFQVHLWLACNAEDLPSPGGASAAEFSVEISPSWTNLGFHTVASAKNAGDETTLLLAFDCPQGPYRAGHFDLLDGTGLGGEACLVPSSMWGNNVTVDCHPIVPEQHDNAVIGFSTSGPPCTVGFCSPTVPVEGSAWGTVKALYR